MREKRRKKKKRLMPIGVPRIIYCWGEELPPQWTDIYNFIYRRRMIFLMQYLDDDLCNQICGLLINIHMEDRSKELEKKELEKSGVGRFKTTALDQKNSGETKKSSFDDGKGKKEKYMEDLLHSYGNNSDSLAIDENYTLEQYTLQKITLEWLNWNAQFFDYSDEPYLFYLAEILSKDFTKNDAQLFYQTDGSSFAAAKQQSCLDKNEMASLVTILKHSVNNGYSPFSQSFSEFNRSGFSCPKEGDNASSKDPFDVYSPFRSIFNLNSSFAAAKDPNFSLKNLLANLSSPLKQETKTGLKQTKELLKQLAQLHQKPGLTKLVGDLASNYFCNQNQKEHEKQLVSVLGQRDLKREYRRDNLFGNSLIEQSNLQNKKIKPLNYLDSTNNHNSYGFGNSKNRNDYSRKQTKQALQEEEFKKVFVIINSFGGSVGNGITVHDALQFIKAGSLTLGLGVAASAASLVLAGGTISERYVTEGCHVMIHQPESGLNGQASDIWIDSQEIMKIRLDVAEIYSLSAHRPRHKILRDLDRDFYLTATETIHYGLADEIATNEVMHEIIEMTSKVWDYHDSKQQRLLETRDSASSGLDTQTQN